MAEKTAQETTPKPKRCFMITPIGAAGSPERRHADWVWGGAVEPLFVSRGYDLARADKIADPAPINDAIFAHIEQDEVCVADLTFLNANVFYELGVRHALALPVIHIAAEGTRLPFDNMPYRTIFFERDDFQSFETLKSQLAAQLDAIETPDFRVSNPLTHARGRIDLKPSADTRDNLIDTLISQVSEITRRVDAIEIPSSVTRNALAHYVDAQRQTLSETLQLMQKYAGRYATGTLTLGDVDELSIRMNISELGALDRLYLLQQGQTMGIPAAKLTAWGLQPK